jgi:hypothetical protein
VIAEHPSSSFFLSNHPNQFNLLNSRGIFATMSGKIEEADVIGPDVHPKKGFNHYIKVLKRTFLTKDGLIGDYDYAFLFTPNLPFTGRKNVTGPFFGLNDKMPVLLALILGLQHSLAMLAGVITPGLILSGEGGAHLSPEMQQYLVSTSLIVCGILTTIQITRFHIYKTP